MSSCPCSSEVAHWCSTTESPCTTICKYSVHLIFFKKYLFIYFASTLPFCFCFSEVACSQSAVTRSPQLNPCVFQSTVEGLCGNLDAQDAAWMYFWSNFRKSAFDQNLIMFLLFVGILFHCGLLWVWFLFLLSGRDM